MRRRTRLLAVAIMLVTSVMSAAAAQAKSRVVAHGSVQQVYAVGLKPHAKVALLDRGGQVAATQKADGLGGIVFRDVTPGAGYRLRAGPKTVGELAATEGVRAPSMTQIINRMEEAGWVTRSAGPVRGRTVQITDAGVAVSAAVREERSARLAKRLDGLSADDLTVLEAALPVLDRIFGSPLSY